MNFKKAFLRGALIGGGLALLFLLWELFGPHPGFLFLLCPFYALMYMNVVHTMTAVIVIAFIGNAVLYGVLAVLLLLAYRILRKITRGPSYPSTKSNPL